MHKVNGKSSGKVSLKLFNAIIEGMSMHKVSGKSDSTFLFGFMRCKGQKVVFATL